MKKIMMSFANPAMCFSLFEELPELAGKEMSVGTAAFPKGMQTSGSADGITIHEHHHKLIFMLEGTIDVVAGDIANGGQKLQATADEMLVVPAGEPHSGIVLEDTKLIFVLYGDGQPPVLERLNSNG